ncbi:phakinin [Willisornis vidua]|uniref:Phakinin n=1 Tax=Willisornis vidua TaxID=1566151 RepID=A0ABQ9CRB7_9PASS|nr:phakinin [Willisornis vidua]
MPLPRRRSSFLGQQPSSSTAESSGPPGRRVSVGGGGSLSRPPGVYVGTVPTGGVSSLGTRVSRRALGISSVFLQGLRSSAAAVPLAPGLDKGRALSYESLNGCLVEYIEKVRALEQVNQELEEHIRVYLDKKAASVGSWGALRENWEAIYHQVGEAVLENARLMLHTENIQACAEDFKDRYENEQPFRKAVEDEINSLYKVIDDANLTKMDLESQIESMKEELTLLSKTHEEDVKVLYKQLAGSQLEELDVPMGSGLDDILEKIRIHWERDIEKNRAETGALLRTKKRGLENSLYDAKHWHDIELQNLGSVISKLEAEMGEIKVETEQQQRDRENLLTSKQQLEKDIAAYHCLLDGEQSRLYKMHQDAQGTASWQDLPLLQDGEERLASSTVCHNRHTAVCTAAVGEQRDRVLRAPVNSYLGTGIQCRVLPKEEDDWKEFEQKEEIDYSGLRVQSMQISEKEDDESEKREEPGDNWEESGGGGVDRSSGPWNKSAPAPAPVVEPIVTETPEPVQAGGVYRPPGAREGGRPRRAQQGPPEIYSDTQFPSLQSTAKLVDSRKDKEMEKSFEVVKYKTRGRDEVSKNQALKLQLDNQYAVLGDQ